MLARLFGIINSAYIFLIGIYALILVGAHILLHHFGNNEVHFLWQDMVLQPAVGIPVMLLASLFAVFGAQVILVNKHKLLNRNAYLPFLLAPVLLVFSINGNLNTVLQIGFVLLVINSWLNTFHADKLYTRALNTGIIIGLSSLLDVRMTLLLLVTYVVYLIFGRMNLRTLLIPVVGYLTVWLNAMAIEYLIFDGVQLMGVFKSGIIIETSRNMAPFNWHYWALLGAMAILSIPEIVKTLNRASVMKRQTFAVTLVLMAFAGLSFFINGAATFQAALILPTVALVFANALQNSTRMWMKELAMWAVLVFWLLSELKIL